MTSLRDHRREVGLRALRRCSLAVLVCAAALRSAHGADPSAVGSDARLGPLVSLRQERFPFSPPESEAAWREQAERVRRRVAVAAGLWPAPDRHEPRATVHGRVEREGYTVEKVSLESVPGHFVTGNLYRPKGREGRSPGVLCPYGHWPEGRFQRWGDDEIERQLAQGAERYELGGRHPIQARCVQLARMGCVVFVYDMLGYGDSLQIAFKSVHQPSEESIAVEADRWGFYSTQAELRMLSPLGLQTLNSQYALDWLASLPGVDPERIGVTGGSSGATQTLMLGAIDPRPAVAFPVVMVSTAMQGGCGCENACALRVGMGNVEIAALFAPKPLGMASADDWTKDFITDGFPELQRLYAMLGAPDHVMLASLTRFPHNYNYASRAALYPWMNRWLKLGVEEPIVEQDFEPLTEREMRVWGVSHPAPPSGPDEEPRLLRVMDADSQRRMARLAPRDAPSLAEFRRVVGGAFEVLLSREHTDNGKGELEIDTATLHGTYQQARGVVRSSRTGAYLPTIVLNPEAGVTGVVLWIDGAGKQALFAETGEPRHEVARLLEAGFAVVGADLLYQGEMLADGMTLNETPMVDERWPVASLTYGYNRSVLAQRASDVLTLASVTYPVGQQDAALHIIATGGSAPYVAAAGAIADGHIDSLAIDTENFRFDRLGSWRDPHFLPGAVKYGDLPALLALYAPRTLLLGGEGDTGPLLTVQAYRAARAKHELTLVEGNDFAEIAVDTLLKRLE